MRKMTTVSTNKVPNSFLRLRGTAAIAAGAGLIIACVLGVIGGGPQLLFQAFLYAWILSFGLAMGSQALLYIHHMTAGAWSFPIQRMLEASARTIYVLGPIFLIGYVAMAAIGVNQNYEVWIHPHEGALKTIIESKAWWLNVPGWAGRSVLYILLAMGMAYVFSNLSKKLDDTGDALITLQFRKLSPVFLLVYCGIMTFAPLDWVMSLEPAWFSTIYGPLFAISQALTIMAVFILILERLARDKPMSAIIQVENYHMLSTFMFAFTLMWAYMSFSQYLIIWSGNLPEEIHYYLARNTNFYIGLSLLLMVGHFFIPFLGLLQKHRLKNKIYRLKLMCYFMLIMRLCDLFYIIHPSFQDKALTHDITADPGAPWFDLVVYVAMALGLLALWFYLFIGQLSKMNLLPKNDPRMYKAISHINEEMFENV